jgi:hypothetical protein
MRWGQRSWLPHTRLNIANDQKGKCGVAIRSVGGFLAVTLLQGGWIGEIYLLKWSLERRQEATG